MMNSGMSTRRRKLPSSYNNSSYYDLNVPLSSSSSSKQELQNLAQTHQTRLHQLGYHGVAFCHTAYNGRLKVERDDADVALPWKILLPSSSLLSASLKSSSSSLPSSSSLSLVAKAEADGTPINHSAPPPSSSSTKFSTFGRTHSLTSMKIYRRLNIILEELSDVSRILLHHAGSGVGGAGENEMNEVQTLLQKYDIISLQPMNESVLQSICELLASSAASSSTASSTATNNTNLIDIVVLEYATGSRGGYSLPYKLRREYLENALRAGVTFELCYGTAVLDPKRRQGFLRSLIDFQSAYNGIQKKHLIMNNHRLVERAKKKRGRMMNKKLSKYKIPLLISSGSRQNYTLGTADEGTLAFRGPQDIKCLILHLAGVGEVEVEVDFDSCDGDGGTDCITVDDTRRNKRKEHNMWKEEGPISAAERVLARAHGRALGKVMIDDSGIVASVQRQSLVPDSTLQQQQNGTGKSKDDTEDDYEEDDRDFTSVVDWLSAPLLRNRKEEHAMKNDADEEKPCTPPPPSNDATSSRLSAVLPPPPTQEEGNSLDGEDDLEDGYIAI